MKLLATRQIELGEQRIAQAEHDFSGLYELYSPEGVLMAAHPIADVRTWIAAARKNVAQPGAGSWVYTQEGEAIEA